MVFKSKLYGYHLENRKIATPRDDNEWTTQAHWPSAMMDF